MTSQEVQEVAVQNISELDKLKWYGEKELKSLCVYDPACFDKSNGVLLKKWGKKTYVLGASALDILKKKYNVQHNETDFVDVISLARILQNPYVFDHIKQNPSIKVEKRIGNSKVDFIHISNLGSFKDVGPLERKLSEDEKIELIGKIPELKLSFQDMKYISDHRYKRIEEIEKFVDVPSPIIEAALYKMRAVELPSKEEALKLARIVEAIQESKNKKWTTQEIEVLKRLYSIKGDSQVSKDLKIDVDEIQETAARLGLEKINPYKRYNLNEILDLTGLRYEEINQAIYSNELKFEIFDRERKYRDTPENGVVFVTGSSLISFMEKGGRKKYVSTRREKFDIEMCKKNPSYNDANLISRMLASPLLNHDEETDLLIRMKNGDALARDDIVEANYRLAMSIAKKMASKGRSLSIEDLFQEGCVGLIDFTTRYDLEKKSKKGRRYNTSTYATWWVVQRISRAIVEKGDIVRRPAHIPWICNKIATYSQYYIEKNGEVPSIANISSALKISRRRIRDLMHIVKSAVYSLNHPLGEDGESELEAVIADENISGKVYYRIEENILKRDVCENLKKMLTKREYAIFEKRYGFDGMERTLEQVGNMYGLTRERVRQICEKVIKKARRNKELKAMLKNAGLNF
jgi:RNA polymerase primary sigma factor